METINKKSEIKYDIITCLSTIQDNEDLDFVLREETSMDYAKLLKLAKEDMLPENLKKYISGMFKIILKNKTFLTTYLDNYTVTEVEEVEEVTEEVKAEPKPKPKKKKKVIRLNKKVNQAFINANDGVAKPVHSAALKMFRLRNLYELLERKYNDEMYYDTELGDKTWNGVISAIETLDKKLEMVLKK